jgi:hypothetical protein
MPNGPRFDIESIHELAYWFREPKEEIPKSDNALDFVIEHNFKVDPEASSLDVVSTIEIRREQGAETSRRPPLLHFEVRFMFSLHEIDFTTHPDEDPEYEYIQLPQGFLAALVGTAYSTSRGILFARTAGSQLHSYVLPIANPIAMMEANRDRLRKKRDSRPTSKEPEVKKLSKRKK